jgi:transcriptional regulator with XRE-family HTH domain
MEHKDNLKRVRIERGLSRHEVADRMRLQCINRLSSWETDKVVRHVKNLKKLREIYKVPMEQLL